jgi:hypothetical protein
MDWNSGLTRAGPASATLRHYSRSVVHNLLVTIRFIKPKRSIRERMDGRAGARKHNRQRPAPARATSGAGRAQTRAENEKRIIHCETGRKSENKRPASNLDAGE